MASLWTVDTAIILAGGLGTRLRAVVPDLPKPMAPINGRPFMEHQLDYWIGQGITRFVLSVGYRADAIMGHFASQYKGAKIQYVVEEVPLGTGGGAVLAAGRLSREHPFLVLNGDTYFAVELAELADFASESNADWCFSLFRPTEAGRYMGMSVSEQGRIVALRSEPGGPANGGVYWVHPRALVEGGFQAGTKASLEDDILPAALASGRRLFGREFGGAFIDIGVPADYHRASKLLGEVSEVNA